MFKNYRVRDYDIKLILMVLAVSVLGVLTIGSAREIYKDRQIMGLILGVIVMLIISFLDYSYLLNFYWVLYIVNIGLLVLVQVMGDTSGGAQRWLNLGSIRFQPSETAKIILILFYAQFIMKHRDNINSVRTIVTMLLLLCPPLLLIYKQPDLSTSIMIILIFCSIWFIGGLSSKIILGVLAVAIPSAVIFLMLVLQPNQNLIQEYQQTRILAWLNPEKYSSGEAYQQNNAIMAIGSGQLWGKGLNNNVISSVKNGNFISEPHTDFIFTVVGEELGFVGACGIVILLFLITLECIIVAKKAKDLAGACIATGMAALIGFQSFINIAVSTGLLPNTGIPLPFLSYGLTSLLSLYIGLGFVLNVRLQCVRKYNN